MKITSPHFFGFLCFLWMVFGLCQAQNQKTVSVLNGGQQSHSTPMGPASGAETELGVIEFQKSGNAERGFNRSGFNQVTLDFEGINGAGFLPPDYYQSIGFYLEPGKFFAGQLTACNHGGTGAAAFDFGSAYINVPNGFTEIGMDFAAITPPNCGSYAVGFSVYSGFAGSGSLLYQRGFAGFPTNGSPEGGCLFDSFESTGLIGFGGILARSVVFWEWPHPCPSMGSPPYRYNGFDDVVFTLAPASVNLFDQPQVLYEGENSGHTFGVNLANQLEPGSTVVLQLTRVDAGDPGESIAVLGNDTLTFTSSNAGIQQSLTIWAPENDENYNNNTATFRLERVGGTSAILMEPVEFTVTEIDDDFRLTVSSAFPIEDLWNPRSKLRFLT